MPFLFIRRECGCLETNVPLLTRRSHKRDCTVCKQARGRKRGGGAGGVTGPPTVNVWWTQRQRNVAARKKTFTTDADGKEKRRKQKKTKAVVLWLRRIQSQISLRRPGSVFCRLSGNSNFIFSRKKVDPCLEAKWQSGDGGKLCKGFKSGWSFAVVGRVHKPWARWTEVQEKTILQPSDCYEWGKMLKNK